MAIHWLLIFSPLLANAGTNVKYLANSDCLTLATVLSQVNPRLAGARPAPPRALFTQPRCSRPVMQAQYRELFRHAAAPVTVITTALGREKAGMTISSLASLSIGPPELLVTFNVQTPSRTGDFLRSSPFVVLNTLSATPSNVLLAKSFAGINGQRINPFEKFPDLFTKGEDSRGIPRIANAASQLLCEVQQVVPIQDHELMVAKVHKMWIQTGTPPLIYRDHQFCPVSEDPVNCT